MNEYRIVQYYSMKTHRFIETMSIDISLILNYIERSLNLLALRATLPFTVRDTNPTGFHCLIKKKKKKPRA